MTSLVFDDLLALGAACLPDAALVRLLLPDTDGARVRVITELLLLDDHARSELLRYEPEGPFLLAALELGRRALRHPTRRGLRLAGPSDVAAVVAPLLPNDEERLVVLALDGGMRVARRVVIGGGDPAHVDAPLARVLGPVLAAGCARLVVAHRHLFGRAEPSTADRLSSVLLAEAARTVGLTVVDHVILGEDGISSLAREGVIPSGWPSDARAAHDDDAHG